MFGVYFIMQMSNGCRLTWFKWVNSIFLFTLIIQTATKKKKALKTNLGNLFLSPTLPTSQTTANTCYRRETGASQTREPRRGAAPLVGAQLLPQPVPAVGSTPWAAHGPVPRMILVPWSSVGAGRWQTEQIWIGKIRSWHRDMQLRWMQRRAAHWRWAGSRAVLA